jgi:hypothetical protein
MLGVLPAMLEYARWLGPESIADVPGLYQHLLLEKMKHRVKLASFVEQGPCRDHMRLVVQNMDEIISESGYQMRDR